MIRTTNTKSYNMVKYPTVFQTGCAERAFVYLGLVELFYIGSGYCVGKPQPFGTHVGIFSRSFSMIVVASRLFSHFVGIVFSPVLKRCCMFFWISISPTLMLLTDFLVVIFAVTRISQTTRSAFFFCCTIPVLVTVLETNNT